MMAECMYSVRRRDTNPRRLRALHPILTLQAGYLTGPEQEFCKYESGRLSSGFGGFGFVPFRSHPQGVGSEVGLHAGHARLGRTRQTHGLCSGDTYRWYSSSGVLKVVLRRDRLDGCRYSWSFPGDVVSNHLAASCTYNQMPGQPPTKLTVQPPGVHLC